MVIVRLVVLAARVRGETHKLRTGRPRSRAGPRASDQSGARYSARRRWPRRWRYPVKGVVNPGSQRRSRCRRKFRIRERRRSTCGDGDAVNSSDRRGSRKKCAVAEVRAALKFSFKLIWTMMWNMQEAQCGEKFVGVVNGGVIDPKCK